MIILSHKENHGLRIKSRGIDIIVRRIGFLTGSNENLLEIRGVKNIKELVLKNRDYRLIALTKEIKVGIAIEPPSSEEEIRMAYDIPNKRIRISRTYYGKSLRYK